MTRWEDIGYKKESFYERHIKKPDWWWVGFVGPRKPWGGKRKGSGKKAIPKPFVEGLTIVVKLNRIQQLSLQEMGDGDLSKGIEALVNQYM
jgi:hypothetical protein